jgi:GT2 family glycosyltransferase/glycosyltransferase involved in cell wall biosynthesis
MRPVTVIIPVYNAFDVTLDCVRSVLSTIPKQVKVCIIDDASPSGDLREFLPNDVLRHSQIEVLRNDKNLGFVGTCNRGMLIESQDDVILLNSDTLVTKNWVQKLQRAAYSRVKIGTVTPLTNNGTICSIPCFLENNEVPDGYSLDSFAGLVEEVSEREYVQAPTCVGFCTYIRREMLDDVGVFDPVFQQGYGEENDLSLRAAQRGYANIVDDATYIYHRGNMSFKEMRESLSKTNAEILNQRYPSYEHDVGRFCASNPLSRVHDRIWNVLVPRWLGSHKRTVLHVLHNGPFVPRHHGLGGTELHVQSIIRNDRESAHFSLTPGKGCTYLTCHTSLGDRTLTIPQDRMEALIDQRFFAMVHLHHCFGFDRSLLCEALQRHGNYVVSVHDYHLICGRLWLIKPDGSVCDGGACGGTCGESQVVASQRRDIARNIFRWASRIVVFSESTRNIISSLFGEYSSLEIHPHGIDIPSRRPIPIPGEPCPKVPLKVLCVGTFVPHKGSELVAQCAAIIDCVEDVPVEWHFLGRGAEDVAGLRNWGAYTPQDLGEKIEEIGAHVALLAPQCQETYSLTLDELIWSGLPVICSPFGALPERVAKWNVGYTFDNSLEGLRNVLGEIVRKWGRHADMFIRAQRIEIRSCKDEISDYAHMYEDASSMASDGAEALIRFLQPELCWNGPYSPKTVIRRAKRTLATLIRKVLAEGECIQG